MTKAIKSMLIILPLVCTNRIVAQPADQATPEKSAPPQLQIDDPVKNFGSAWTGQQLRHDFVIRNTGKGDLVIQRIDYASGCYQSGEHTATIPPGESTVLSIVADTREITGDFERTATLFTNDPQSPRQTLRLRGTCNPPIEIQPAFIGFGKIIGDGPQQRSATIRNKTDETFELTLTTAEDTRFAYELIETTPGEEYKLFATTKVPMAHGRNESFVTLTTSLQAQPSMRVRVFSYVPPRLEIMPSTITLDPDKLQNSPRGLTKVVVYSNNGDRPVHLKGAIVDDPDIQITTSEILAGKSYRIVVQVPRGYNMPPHGTGLTLQTDDSVFSTIRVPIRLAAGPSQAQPPGPTDDGTILKMVGQKAPSFELTTYEGKALTNANLAEAITVLNFFAVGDHHNIAQIKKMEELRQKYASRGIRFVNVAQRNPNFDATQEDQVELLAKFDIKSELAFDLGNTVGATFNLVMYPTMVVFGKNGVIEGIVEGNEPDLPERAAKQYETLLAGRSIAAPPAPTQRQQRPALTMIGQPAPEFTLQIDADHTVSSSDLAASPVTVLNFVAPNCGFCRRQLPVVESVRSQYEDKGVRFVTVGQTFRKEFTREEIAGVFQDVGSHGALAHDPKNEVGRMFKVTSYPTMAIIRRDGEIQDVIIGAKKDLDELMKQQLEQALEKDKLSAKP